MADDVVKLTEVPTEAEAAELCGFLRANGIEAAYDKGDVNAGLSWATPTGGAQEILVRSADLERADRVWPTCPANLTPVGRTRARRPPRRHRLQRGACASALACRAGGGG